VAASPAADGRAFFYTNPLHKRTPGHEADPDEVSARALASLRAPWFEVSCCPTNVARTFAQLACYLATRTDEGVQLLQYAPAVVDTTLADNARVRLEVVTGYPADGEVVVRVLEAPDRPWTLDLRVPAWAAGATLDGQPVAPGAARVPRSLAAGDEVRLVLPVAPRLVAADPRVDAVRGCVAVERGPLVLCAESTDLPDGLTVDDFRVVPGSLTDATSDHDGAVRPVARLRAVRVRHEDQPWPYAEEVSAPPEDEIDVPLVPYQAWANRGPSTMRVWLPAT
jgi:uncharacterized protein